MVTQSGPLSKGRAEDNLAVGPGSPGATPAAWAPPCISGPPAGGSKQPLHPAPRPTLSVPGSGDQGKGATPSSHPIHLMEFGLGPKDLQLNHLKTLLCHFSEPLFLIRPVLLVKDNLQQKLGESCGKTHLSKQVKNRC